MPKPTRKPYEPADAAGRARLQRVVHEVEAERDDIVHRGTAALQRADRIEQVVEALVAARRAKGLTVTDVANATGMAQPNVSRLEGSATRGPNPTLRTLLAYAEAIGVDIDIVVRDRQTGRRVKPPEAA